MFIFYIYLFIKLKKMQSTTTDFTSNQWVHLMLSIDKSNSNVSFYKNGSLIETHSNTEIAFNDNIKNESMLLGSSFVQTKSNYQGYIDDFTLFDKTLATTEVNTVYNSYNTINSLPLNDWSHVAVNYDKVRKESHISINGVEVGKYENYDAVINNNTSNIVFGGSSASTGSGFVGELGEVTIFERPLSTNEINHLVTNEERHLGERVIFEATFKDLSSTEMVDSSSNNVNATLANTPASYIVGHTTNSKALAFNGSQTATLAYSQQYNNFNQMTINCVMKHDLSSITTLIQKDSVFKLYIDTTGGNLKFDIFDAGVPTTYVSSSATFVEANTYVNIVVEVDKHDSFIKFYKDHVLTDTFSGITINMPQDNTNNIVMGSGLKGGMSYMQIDLGYNAYTTEMNVDYSAYLLANYTFDESGGTTAIDKSTNANHGTLVNNPLRSFGTYDVQSKGLKLDGTLNQSVTIAGTPYSSVDLNTMTLSAWVNTVDNAAHKSIVSKGSTEFDFAINADGKMEFTAGAVTCTSSVNMFSIIESFETTPESGNVNYSPADQTLTFQTGVETIIYLPDVEIGLNGYIEFDVTPIDFVLLRMAFGVQKINTIDEIRLQSGFILESNSEISNTAYLNIQNVSGTRGYFNPANGWDAININNHLLSSSPTYYCRITRNATEMLWQMFEDPERTILKSFDSSATYVHEFTKTHQFNDDDTLKFVLGFGANDEYSMLPSGKDVVISNVKVGGASSSAGNNSNTGWNHLAVTLDEYKGEVKFYKNGTVTDTFTPNPFVNIPMTTTELTIGNNFTGELDNVMIHKGVVDLATETQLYTIPDSMYTPQTITSESWTHVAAVYDKEKNMVSMFQNGQHTGSFENYMTDFTDVGVNNSNIFIGTTGDSTTFYDGILDDVRVYKSALTTEDIGELYAIYDQTVISYIDKTSISSEFMYLDGVPDVNVGNVTIGDGVGTDPIQYYAFAMDSNRLSGKQDMQFFIDQIDTIPTTFYKTNNIATASTTWNIGTLTKVISSDLITEADVSLKSSVYVYVLAQNTVTYDIDYFKQQIPRSYLPAGISMETYLDQTTNSIKVSGGSVTSVVRYCILAFVDQPALTDVQTFVKDNIYSQITTEGGSYLNVGINNVPVYVYKAPYGVPASHDLPPSVSLNKAFISTSDVNGYAVPTYPDMYQFTTYIVAFDAVGNVIVDITYTPTYTPVHIVTPVQLYTDTHGQKDSTVTYNTTTGLLEFSASLGSATLYRVIDNFDMSVVGTVYTFEFNNIPYNSETGHGGIVFSGDDTSLTTTTLSSGNAYNNIKISWGYVDEIAETHLSGHDVVSYNGITLDSNGKFTGSFPQYWRITIINGSSGYAYNDGYVEVYRSSDYAESSKVLSFTINGNGLRGTAYVLNHGCFSNSSAVARFFGSKSNIGFKNAVSSIASSSSNRYFSTKTRSNVQNFKFLIFLNSHERLKKSFDRFPPRAIFFGIFFPASSTMSAK